MAEYNVELTHKHQLSAADARVRAEEFVESIKNEYNLKWEWQDNTINFKVESGLAKGVSGVVRLDDGSVFVGGKLPFALQMMKSLVQQQLGATLTKVFR